LRSASGETSELRVRGMPLGLMPGMDYEEINFSLRPGEELFLYSDGLTEAHNPQGEMYESPRLLRQLAAGSTPEEILRSLYEFTGPGWEQEDDMTMLVIQHSALAETVLADFEVESAPNNERWAVEQISAALQALGLPGSLVERVSTATAEAVMNAMEHGNRFQVDRPVGVRLVQAPGMLRVQVTDSGLGMPVDATAGPDLEAKLDGRQPYRGWGKALIQSMCDRSSDRTGGGLHCVEMEFDLDKEVDHG
jgi:anti-sigma regulatory factor (Ser/Thr protein kinase)